MALYYRRVELNEDGETVEPVCLVATHPLRWWDGGDPECGFVEAEDVIAAAPDLLEACKVALAQLDLCIHDIGCVRDEVDHCSCGLRQAKAGLRAAIARAEGQA